MGNRRRIPGQPRRGEARPAPGARRAARCVPDPAQPRAGTRFAPPAGADLLAQGPPPATSGWSLGPPDLVLTGSAREIPAAGVVPSLYETLDVPLDRDVWVRAVDLQPSNPRLDAPRHRLARAAGGREARADRGAGLHARRPGLPLDAAHALPREEHALRGPLPRPRAPSSPRPRRRRSAAASSSSTSRTTTSRRAGGLARRRSGLRERRAHAKLGFSAPAPAPTPAARWWRSSSRRCAAPPASRTPARARRAGSASRW